MKRFFKTLFKELFQDERSGKISSAKFWLNVAFCVSSFLVIYMAVKDSLSVDIFVAYVLIVSGNNLTSKFLSMKYDKRNNDIFHQEPPVEENTEKENDLIEEGNKK